MPGSGWRHVLERTRTGQYAASPIFEDITNYYVGRLEGQYGQLEGYSFGFLSPLIRKSNLYVPYPQVYKAVSFSSRSLLTLSVW